MKYVRYHFHLTAWFQWYLCLTPTCTHDGYAFSENQSDYIRTYIHTIYLVTKPAAITILMSCQTTLWKYLRYSIRAIVRHRLPKVITTCPSTGTMLYFDPATAFTLYKGAYMRTFVIGSTMPIEQNNDRRDNLHIRNKIRLCYLYYSHLVKCIIASVAT